MAAQLTQSWTEAVWTRVERLLREGDPVGTQERASRTVKTFRRYSRLSSTQVALLVADYQSGMTIQAVARKYRVDPDTASRWLKTRGVRRPVKVAIPPDKLAEALALREQGWSYERIGERFGCSRPAATAALKRAGLQPTD